MNTKEAVRRNREAAEELLKAMPGYYEGIVGELCTLVGGDDPERNSMVVQHIADLARGFKVLADTMPQQQKPAAITKELDHALNLARPLRVCLNFTEADMSWYQKIKDFEERSDSLDAAEDAIAPRDNLPSSIKTPEDAEAVIKELTAIEALKQLMLQRMNLIESLPKPSGPEKLADHLLIYTSFSPNELLELNRLLSTLCRTLEQTVDARKDAHDGQPVNTSCRWLIQGVKQALPNRRKETWVKVIDLILQLTEYENKRGYKSFERLLNEPPSITK